MENELENLLRAKMSLEDMGINSPDESLVLKARNKVALRKKSNSNVHVFIDNIKSVFFIQNRAYHFILTALIITGFIFYFSKPNEESLQISKNNNYTGKTGAITSSTILATLDELPQRKSSVNTSTALTSITTFVTRN